MAIKQGKYRPPTNDYNDVIHFETDSEMVIMGDGSKLEDKLKQMENNAYDAGGSGNSYTVSGLALVDNGTYVVIPNHSNTGATTLNGKGIKKFDADSDAYIDLEEGDIVKNTPIQLVWDASQDFFVFAPKGGAGASGGNYEKLGYLTPPMFEYTQTSATGVKYPNSRGVMISPDKQSILVSYYRDDGGGSNRQCGILNYNIQSGLVNYFSHLPIAYNEEVGIHGATGINNNVFIAIGTSELMVFNPTTMQSVIQKTVESSGRNYLVHNGIIYFHANGYSQLSRYNSNLSGGRTGGHVSDNQGWVTVCNNELVWFRQNSQEVRGFDLDTLSYKWQKNRTSPSNTSGITHSDDHIFEIGNYNGHTWLRKYQVTASAVTANFVINLDQYKIYKVSQMKYDNDKIYVMYFKKDYDAYQRQINLLCINAKTGGIEYNLTTGIGNQQKSGFFDVKSGNITTYQSYTGNSPDGKCRINNTLVVFEENVLSKKDLIKELTK